MANGIAPGLSTSPPLPEHKPFLFGSLGPAHILYSLGSGYPQQPPHPPQQVPHHPPMFPPQHIVFHNFWYQDRVIPFDFFLRSLLIPFISSVFSANFSSYSPLSLIFLRPSNRISLALWSSCSMTYYLSALCGSYHSLKNSSKLVSSPILSNLRNSSSTPSTASLFRSI